MHCVAIYVTRVISMISGHVERFARKRDSREMIAACRSERANSSIMLGIVVHGRLGREKGARIAWACLRTIGIMIARNGNTLFID